MIESSSITPELREKIHFRLKFSEEKLNVAQILLNNSKANDALLYAYLSLFYAVRALLVHDNHDSNDFEEIMTLYEKYYQQEPHFTIDIAKVMRNSKNFRDKIDSDESVIIPMTEAEECVEYAHKVFANIKTHLMKSLK